MFDAVSLTMKRDKFIKTIKRRKSGWNSWRLFLFIAMPAVAAASAPESIRIDHGKDIPRDHHAVHFRTTLQVTGRVETANRIFTDPNGAGDRDPRFRMELAGTGIERRAISGRGASAGFAPFAEPDRNPDRPRSNLYTCTLGSQIK